MHKRTLTAGIAALTLTIAGTSCTSLQQPAPTSTHPSDRLASTRVIPTESPPANATETPLNRTPHTAATGPAPTVAAVPSPAIATTPVATARAWAIAANSSSYHDPTPGTWTRRAQPFVTGAEAATEGVQRGGGGGSTWSQILSGRCALSLYDLAAAVDHDAPASHTVVAVNVSATAALSCSTHTVQLSNFAAQLILNRIGEHWYVARVTH